MPKQYCCFGHSKPAKACLPPDFDIVLVSGSHYSKKKVCNPHYQLARQYMEASAIEKGELKKKIVQEMLLLEEQRKKSNVYHKSKQSKDLQANEAGHIDEYGDEQEDEISFQEGPEVTLAIEQPRMTGVEVEQSQLSNQHYTLEPPKQPVFE